MHLFLLRWTLFTGFVLFLKAPFKVEFKGDIYALFCNKEGIGGVYDRVGINQIIFSFNISNKIRIVFLCKNFLIAWLCLGILGYILQIYVERDIY